MKIGKNKFSVLAPVVRLASVISRRRRRKNFFLLSFVHFFFLFFIQKLPRTGPCVLFLQSPSSAFWELLSLPPHHSFRRERESADRRLSERLSFLLLLSSLLLPFSRPFSLCLSSSCFLNRFLEWSVYLDGQKKTHGSTPQLFPLFLLPLSNETEERSRAILLGKRIQSGTF